MSLARLNLVAYRSASVTPDMAAALRVVQGKVSEHPGTRLLVKEPSRPAATSLSLATAGREIRLQLRRSNPMADLGMLWGLLVPLGFTPKNRYPVPGADDDVFHFLGPWQGLIDYMCGIGCGELAWPAVCCAAQVDVGTWDGDRTIDRFVQAQLHRLGLHCGPLDGIITDQVNGALRALGIVGKTLEEAAAILAAFRTPPIEVFKRRVGHIVVPGDDLSVVAYGRVATTRTRQGVALTIDGPGRVVLDIGQGET